jgi:hypothetical protein
MREVLPNVDGVAVFADSAAATIGVSEVRVFGARKPGVGTEDSAPVLARLGSNRNDIADGIGREPLLGELRVLGQRVVVADADEGAGFGRGGGKFATVVAGPLKNRTGRWQR